MSELKHVINLVLGDWSHDGHKVSETYTIESNLTTAEVEKAYEASVKKMDVDLVEHIAADYEDNQLCREDYDVFKAHGFKFKLNDWSKKELEEGDSFAIDVGTFIKLYLFMVKLGNPDFEWKKIDNDIMIGGYGLYYG